MEALVAFWSHALAAALYCALVLWELRRGIRIGSEHRMLLAALALTACWAWLTAVEPLSILAAYAETARNLAWVGVLYRLAEGDSDEIRQRGVQPVYAAVAGVLGLQMLIDTLPLMIGAADAGAALHSTAIILRLTAAAGALVLVHNLYGQAAPASRASIRLAMLGLALMWIYDLNLYTVAYIDHGAARGLFDWRGLAVAATAPLIALGGARGEGWRIRLSRAATFQSLSLLTICGYFALMAVLAAALRGSGVDWTRNFAVAAMALLTFAAIVLLPSPRARGWAKVKLAKHLFEHRYDYRTEWLRFTETLGAWGPTPRRLASAWSRHSPTCSTRPAESCSPPTTVARSSPPPTGTGRAAPARRRGQPRQRAGLLARDRPRRADRRFRGAPRRLGRRATRSSPSPPPCSPNPTRGPASR